MLYLICIGSNIGDRQENIYEAIDNVILFAGDIKIVSDIKISKIYETPALLPENADLDWNMPFLNIAISFKSDMAPKDVLLILKSIEKKMGRLPAKKWAPRIIDIDILFAGDHIINESAIVENFLIIPHAEFLNRDFFIIPAAEIEPDYVNPLTTKTLAFHSSEITKTCDIISIFNS